MRPARFERAYRACAVRGGAQLMTWFPERIERVCRQPPERCRDLAWLHRGLSTVSGAASRRSWAAEARPPVCRRAAVGRSSPGNGHGVGARRTRYAPGRLRIRPCGIAIRVGVLSGARQHEAGKRCHPRGAASRQGVPGPATPEPPGGRRSLRTTCGYRLTGSRCAPLVHVGCSLDGACAHRGVRRTTSRGTFGRDRAFPGWVSGDWWWSARRLIGASAPRCTVPWLGATTRPSSAMRIRRKTRLIGRRRRRTRSSFCLRCLAAGITKPHSPPQRVMML